MRKYDAIAFDVGDTLIRFSPNWAEVFGDRMASIGCPIDERLRKILSKAVNIAVGEQIRGEQRGGRRATDEELLRIMDEAALVASVGGAPEPERLAALEALRGVPLPEQRRVVMDGVHDLLTRLRGAGYRLAIVSNFSASLQDFLRVEGLDAYFEAIVISEVVGVEKPDPRIMGFALDALGVAPARCLYVGDHPLDVLCAKLAGMDAAWIAEDGDVLAEDIPYREDYRIADATDVAAFLIDQVGT